MFVSGRDERILLGQQEKIIAAHLSANRPGRRASPA